MERREFFKLMGIASASVVSACKAGDADQKLLPYLVPPEEDIVPGEPVFVHSTCVECPAGCGVAVKVRDGKAIKLEGNPEHPINRGALCVRGQASISRLYHPQRFREPLLNENGSFKPIGWERAFELVADQLRKAKQQGLGGGFLSSRTTGALRILKEECCRRLELDCLPEVELLNHGATRQANGWAFGVTEVPGYRLHGCDFLMTVGADILGTYLSPVEFTRQWRQGMDEGRMNWFHFEPYLTISGAKAQRRLTIRPGSEWYLMSFMAHCLPSPMDLPADLLDTIPAFTLNQTAEATGIPPADLDRLLRGLAEAKAPLIIVGDSATANSNGALLALLTAIVQWKMGMVGKTVDFSSSYNERSIGGYTDVLRFEKSCRDKQLGVALLSGLHHMCARPQFMEALQHCQFKVSMDMTEGPLTGQADLVLPLSHPLESWGDIAPRRGILSLIQPALEPLFDTKSMGDILLGLMGEEQTYQQYLAGQWSGFDETWFQTGVREMEPEPQTPALDPQTVLSALARLVEGKLRMANEMNVLLVVPSLRTYDGRSSDIPLLAEIPDPLTTISHGPYAVIAQDIAGDRGIGQGDILRFEGEFGAWEFPVVFGGGIAADTIVVPVEFSQCFTLPGDAVSGEWCLALRHVKTTATGLKVRLPVLGGAKKRQEHGHHKHTGHTLYPPPKHEVYRWGMVIDLDACTGCSACVAACYVENNIPVVGKAEHLRGREMSWLRIETYFDEGPQPAFVPMMCQQCDYAPCETVCPVYATYHNPEGLNAQVYNRCVGTRYCANNCPYKARRFNWFDYEGKLPLFNVSNPDLSVRPKGVMEKCTFCVQRIRYGKGKATTIVPACAQTCPTGAITFGNLLDPKSKVSRLAAATGAYRVLEQLGTEPAVYYIKRSNGKEATKS
jgi:molybdopterin-containing oxidoreductase family iron-sulfur binding subunit